MINNQPPVEYDCAEWTQDTAVNYDVSQQTLFVNCPQPSWVSIRTDQAITVKFNSTSKPSITVNANTAFEMDLRFFKMYITTTVATAMKVIFTQREV